MPFGSNDVCCRASQGVYALFLLSLSTIMRTQLSSFLEIALDGLAPYYQPRPMSLRANGVIIHTWAIEYTITWDLTFVEVVMAGAGDGRRRGGHGKEPKLLSAAEQWAFFNQNSPDCKVPPTQDEKQAATLSYLRSKRVPEMELTLKTDLPDELLHQDNGGFVDQANMTLSANYHTMKILRLEYYKLKLSKTCTSQEDGETKGTLNALENLQVMSEELVKQVKGKMMDAFEMPKIFQVPAQEQIEKIIKKNQIDGKKK